MISFKIKCLTSVVMILLSSWTITTQMAESGYIKARHRMMIKVYPEKSDNTKGPILYSGWMNQDQTLSISTERGRIIYDYRYSENDAWTTDVHAWCRGELRDAVSVP